MEWRHASLSSKGEGRGAAASIRTTLARQLRRLARFGDDRQVGRSSTELISLQAVVQQPEQGRRRRAGGVQRNLEMLCWIFLRHRAAPARRLATHEQCCKPIVMPPACPSSVKIRLSSSCLPVSSQTAASRQSRVRFGATHSDMTRQYSAKRLRGVTCLHIGFTVSLCLQRMAAGTSASSIPLYDADDNEDNVTWEACKRHSASEV